MKQVSIIGVGLIGGSFALDLRHHIPEVCVTGIDHNETHLTEAKDTEVAPDDNSVSVFMRLLA